MGNVETGRSSTQSNSKAVQGTIDKLATGLGKAYSSQSPESRVFGESLYGGLSPDTLAGIEGLGTAANNPVFGQGISDSLNITADVAAGNRFGENDPYYKQLEDQAITSANSPFLSSGTFGSDKHREAVARGTASVRAGQFNDDVARMERAQANLPALLQAGTLPSQIQLGAGQLRDADANARLVAESDLFDRTTNADINLLSRLTGLGAQTAGAAGTTTTQSIPWWQAGLGGLGLGLGFLG